MYSLLGSLDNHGRRMTRSACGSSRHSAGAAGSRRQKFLKRRTLFLYASPTTVNGAFTPSRRRVVARATTRRLDGVKAPLTVVGDAYKNNVLRFRNFWRRDPAAPALCLDDPQALLVIRRP